MASKVTTVSPSAISARIFCVVRYLVGLVLYRFREKAGLGILVIDVQHLEILYLLNRPAFPSCPPHDLSVHGQQAPVRFRQPERFPDPGIRHEQYLYQYGVERFRLHQPQHPPERVVARDGVRPEQPSGESRLRVPEVLGAQAGVRPRKRREEKHEEDVAEPVRGLALHP
jgi:hypothetical protein